MFLVDFYFIFSTWCRPERCRYTWFGAVAPEGTTPYRRFHLAMRTRDTKSFRALRVMCVPDDGYNPRPSRSVK